MQKQSCRRQKGTQSRVSRHVKKPGVQKNLPLLGINSETECCKRKVKTSTAPTLLNSSRLGVYAINIPKSCSFLTIHHSHHRRDSRNQNETNAYRHSHWMALSSDTSFSHSPQEESTLIVLRTHNTEEEWLTKGQFPSKHKATLSAN